MTWATMARRLQESGRCVDRGAAAQEAALLIERFGGVSLSSLMADREADFTSPALLSALERRLEGYPLQYLLGEWGFWGQTYKVTPACLIPRADTECLVEKAVEQLGQGAYFADLCTGSGCVAISTLASRPDCRAVAVDLYEDTLAVARENAVRCGVDDRLTFRHDDVLNPVCTAGEARYDAILSNPPYIRTDVLDTLASELVFEPRAALDGGADGLVFYRAMIRHYQSSLREGGRFFFEIGYDQGEALTRLAHEHGFASLICRDLSGNDRVAILYR